jgi:hypothetical protein
LPYILIVAILRSKVQTLAEQKNEKFCWTRKQ